VEQFKFPSRHSLREAEGNKEAAQLQQCRVTAHIRTRNEHSRLSQFTLLMYGCVFAYTRKLGIYVHGQSSTYINIYYYI
jgi:hypothetical protein